MINFHPLVSTMTLNLHLYARNFTRIHNGVDALLRFHAGWKLFNFTG
jgi:hypothetical protein